MGGQQRPADAGTHSSVDDVHVEKFSSGRRPTKTVTYHADSMGHDGGSGASPEATALEALLQATMPHLPSSAHTSRVGSLDGRTGAGPLSPDLNRTIIAAAAQSAGLHGQMGRRNPAVPKALESFGERDHQHRHGSTSRPGSPHGSLGGSVAGDRPTSADKKKRREEALHHEAALKKKRHVDRLLLFNRLEPENLLGPLNLLVYCWARDESSRAPDLQVPHTLVISNGHPTFWVFTNKHGALKMRNASRLGSRDEILVAFLGRHGRAKHRDVVALFVDPERGLASDRALELTADDLRAFLGDHGTLSLHDGLLQKYTHPFGETNIYIHATWELNGNLEVERLQKNTDALAETVGLGQRVHQQPMLAPAPSPLRARIAAKCAEIYGHVLAVSPQRYQVSMMKLVWKHDSEGRLWLLWCYGLKLTPMAADTHPHGGAHGHSGPHTARQAAALAAVERDEAIRRLQASITFLGSGRPLPWERTGGRGSYAGGIQDRGRGNFALATLAGVAWDPSPPNFNSCQRVPPALATLPPILPSVLSSSMLLEGSQGDAAPPGTAAVVSHAAGDAPLVSRPGPGYWGARPGVTGGSFKFRDPSRAASLPRRVGHVVAAAVAAVDDEPGFGPIPRRSLTHNTFASYSALAADLTHQAGLLHEMAAAAAQDGAAAIAAAAGAFARRLGGVSAEPSGSTVASSGVTGRASRSMSSGGGHPFPGTPSHSGLSVSTTRAGVMSPTTASSVLRRASFSPRRMTSRLGLLPLPPPPPPDYVPSSSAMVEGPGWIHPVHRTERPDFNASPPPPPPPVMAHAAVVFAEEEGDGDAGESSGTAPLLHPIRPLELVLGAAHLTSPHLISPHLTGVAEGEGDGGGETPMVPTPTPVAVTSRHSGRGSGRRSSGFGHRDRSVPRPPRPDPREPRVIIGGGGLSAEPSAASLPSASSEAGGEGPHPQPITVESERSYGESGGATVSPRRSPSPRRSGGDGLSAHGVGRPGARTWASDAPTEAAPEAVTGPASSPSRLPRLYTTLLRGDAAGEAPPQSRRDIPVITADDTRTTGGAVAASRVIVAPPELIVPRYRGRAADATSDVGGPLQRSGDGGAAGVTAHASARAVERANRAAAVKDALRARTRAMAAAASASASAAPPPHPGVSSSPPVAPGSATYVAGVYLDNSVARLAFAKYETLDAKWGASHDRPETWLANAPSAEPGSALMREAGRVKDKGHKDNKDKGLGSGRGGRAKATPAVVGTGVVTHIAEAELSELLLAQPTEGATLAEGGEGDE